VNALGFEEEVLDNAEHSEDLMTLSQPEDLPEVSPER